MKLTKAQIRVLSAIDLLGLKRVFDVWAGTYWKQGVVKVASRTAEVLHEKGLITIGEDVRMHSGHRVASAEITEAGRAILSDLRAEKEGVE